MKAFDGISRSTPPAPPRREPPWSTPRAPRGPRGGLFLLLLLFAGGALLLIRPTPEVEGTTKPTKAVEEETSTDEVTSRFHLPQGGSLDTPLGNLVVLDTPTDTSEPQEDPPSPPASEGQVATSDFTVRILNGGGQPRAAAALQTELEGKGYEVTSIGNAQSTYSRTTVYYQAGKQTQAERVASELGEPTPTVQKDAIAAPADVLVVIGTDR